MIGTAISRIYAEGGILGFWTGNGLSVAKIFPESAIKFFSYEFSVSRLHFEIWGMVYRFLYARNGRLHNIGIKWMIRETLAGSAGFYLGGLVASAVNSVIIAVLPCHFR